MAGRFVRASKYRMTTRSPRREPIVDFLGHVFGRPAKKELCYDNLHISESRWDSNIVKANVLYLSVNWKTAGGGAFAVIPLGEHGRLPDLMPLFRGHSADVLDTDWSPFDDSLVASGSDDGTVCIWTVPPGFSVHRPTHLPVETYQPQDIAPLTTLRGHGKKVGHVLFHPTAENVLASSSGDGTVKIWDIMVGVPKLQLAHDDIIHSMSWSTNGAMLVTTSRDKRIRIWDTRQQTAAHEVPGHGGVKNSRVVWMTGDVDGDRFATTGFSKMSDRQLGLWDLKTLTSGPVGDFQMLDSISGVCMPFWDEGTKCLYLAGKGDGNIRYYEYSKDEFIYLSEYKSPDPQRGLAFLPKRGVSVHENEVMRAFKTINYNLIEPISFIVPRRAETFQADIYPPTQSGNPSVSAEAWFNGATAPPLYFSLETLFRPDAAVTSPVPTTGPSVAPPSPPHTTDPTVSVLVEPPQLTPPVGSGPKSTGSTRIAKDLDNTDDAVTSTRARQHSASASNTVNLPGTTPPHIPTAQPLTSPPDMMAQLSRITALLQSQDIILQKQNEDIQKLTTEVNALKTRVSNTADNAPTMRDVGELEEEAKRKDERIRKLELALEQANS